MWVIIVVAIGCFIAGSIATPLAGIYLFMHSPKLQLQMAQGMTKMMMGGAKHDDTHV